MPILLSFLPWFLSVLALSPLVSGFSFSFDPPTQCDTTTISWTGGTPPFYFHLIPVFGTPRNITVPSNAFSNGRGSFSQQIPFNRGQEILFAMSDSTGWNTGGTTNILTVGASKGGSCDTAQPQVPFSFQLNSALQQCRPFTFSAYDAAVQPVTIYAIVPGGSSLVFNPPAGPTSFSWTANVARGTSMLFMLVDSQGRQGGSSDIIPVANSDDNTCLSNQSPATTSSAPAPGTQTSASTTASSTSTSSPSPSAGPADDKKGGTSVAGIIGGVIGGLLLLAMAASLIVFFLKKRKKDSPTAPTTSSPWNVPAPSYNQFGGQQHLGQGNPSEVYLTYDPNQLEGNSPYGTASRYQYSSSAAAGLAYDSNPFLDTAGPTLPYHTSNPSSPYNPPTPYADSPNQYQNAPPGAYAMQTQYQQPPVTYPPQPAPAQGPVDPFQGPSSPGPDFDPYATDAMAPPSASGSTAQDSMSTAQRKQAMAGVSAYKPSRFIVHTDAEDGLPPPNDDGVVELPPQYTERRAPNVPVAGPSGKGPLP